VKKFENRKNPCEFLPKMREKFLKNQFFHTFDGTADLQPATWIGMVSFVVRICQRFKL
jgi:hypothetical protein